MSSALSWRWRLVVAVARTLKVLLRLRVDVRGLSHVPLKRGAVLAFNHHSYADFVMLGWAVVVEAGRPLRFLGKREIWDSRWIGWAPRWVDAVPVDRSSPEGRAAAFDAAVDALAGGDLVAIAPEQTISASFELLPFRSGAARMAQAAGVPIVPAVGWGSQRLATKGIPLRPRLNVRAVVHFGRPLHVGVDDDPVEVTRRLRERMNEMLHELQEHHPDGAPAGARWVPARLGGSAPSHEDVLREFEQRTRGWSQAPEDEA